MVKVGLLGLSVATLLSAADLKSMFSEGNLDGQIRFFHVDRAYDGLTDVHRNATSIGGKLKYETAKLGGALFRTWILHNQ